MGVSWNWMLLLLALRMALSLRIFWFFIVSVKSEPVGRDYNIWNWSRLEPRAQAFNTAFITGTTEGEEVLVELVMYSDVLVRQVGHLTLPLQFCVRVFRDFCHTFRHSPHSTFTKMFSTSAYQAIHSWYKVASFPGSRAWVVQEPGNEARYKAEFSIASNKSWGEDWLGNDA